MFSLALAVLVWLFVATGEQPIPPTGQGGGAIVTEGKRDLPAQQAGQQRLTLTGVRISQANGVECSKIRTDDGKEVAISYLAPDIAIGDRVTVTGVMANMATCLGPVLKAENVEVLDGG